MSILVIYEQHEHKCWVLKEEELKMFFKVHNGQKRIRKLFFLRIFDANSKPSTLQLILFNSK